MMLKTTTRVTLARQKRYLGSFESKIQQLGLMTAKKHIFLCADQTNPKCCSKEAGLASWDFLKRRLKELNLVGRGGVVIRTKANCLQICSEGPIAVVYPDGVWCFFRLILFSH